MERKFHFKVECRAILGCTKIGAFGIRKDPRGSEDPTQGSDEKKKMEPHMIASNPLLFVTVCVGQKSRLRSIEQFTLNWLTRAAANKYPKYAITCKLGDGEIPIEDEGDLTSFLELIAKGSTRPDEKFGYPGLYVREKREVDLYEIPGIEHIRIEGDRFVCSMCGVVVQNARPTSIRKHLESKGHREKVGEGRCQNRTSRSLSFSS